MFRLVFALLLIAPGVALSADYYEARKTGYGNTTGMTAESAALAMTETVCRENESYQNNMTGGPYSDPGTGDEYKHSDWDAWCAWPGGHNYFGVWFVPDTTPVCEAPLYLDDYGECVEPSEVCYTDLDSMADECVYIGEDDPNDELPSGCVSNPDGKIVCLTEDPNCYTVDGKQWCPPENAVCGEKNGAFQCITAPEGNCGWFNGEAVCFDNDGEPVDEDSPDHPQNGGNLDGDDTNDPTDPRAPADGGDPDNQPGDSPPTTDDNRASERTSRRILNEQRRTNTRLEQINEGIQSLQEETSLTPGQMESDMVAAGDEALGGTGIDSLIDSFGENPMGTEDVEGAGDHVLAILPSGSCSTVSIGIGGHDFQVSCEKTEQMRNLLGFALYAATAMFLFNLIITPVGSRV